MACEMVNNFDGKHILITGGARGIGKALCDAFLQQGAYVAFCASSETSVQNALDYFKSKYESAKIIGFVADVSQAEQVKSLVDNVLKEFGSIEVLINNAGITRDTLIMRMSEDDWSKVLDTNLKGAFLLTKEVIKSMMKARCGAIINMASVVGQAGNAGQANYAASKAGLIALTKSCAKELASRNIRVNAIAPGFVETEMTAKLSEDIKQATLKNIPLKRFAKVEDIANAALFLADDKTSGYITGQVLTVNGGLYI